jgi:hypothetical protein
MLAHDPVEITGFEPSGSKFSDRHVSQGRLQGAMPLLLTILDDFPCFRFTEKENRRDTENMVK